MTCISNSVRLFAWARFVACIALAAACLGSAFAQTQLITNGGFESGWAGWAHTGSFYADSRFPDRAHSGTGYAYLANSDGTPGNNLSGGFSQIITIPANASSATLTFWVSVNTAETGSVARDALQVNVANTTLMTISNVEQPPLNSPHFYSQRSFDLTAYRGSTITISFVATTNDNNPTVFRVDDVAVTVTVLPASLLPPTLTSPPNGGGGQLTRPTFIWSQVGGATSYRIMVAANQASLPRNADADNCTGCVINTTTSNTFYTPTQDLQSATTYWWQVKARSATQTSEWSSQFSFTTAIVCARTPITVGRTVNGLLADSDCEAPHRAGRKADLYTFTGSAGQRVTITLTSTAFDAYLVLVGPNNAVLDEDDDDGGGSNARISFTLPSAGTYTIEATAFANSQRGDYTLKLEAGTCPAATISFDTPINGALSDDDCNAPHRAGRRADSYTFTISQAQFSQNRRVTIALSSTAFDAYLILVDRNNRVIASNDDSGGSNDARIYDFALPSEGTYTIEATCVFSNERGAYRLTLNPGSPNCAPVAIASDTPINGSLTEGDCLAPHRASRKADLYAFTGTAGQRVTITMNSTALDSYLILVDPNNRVVTANNDWNREKNARINNVLLRSTGTYTIEATAFGSAERGDYTLRLNLPHTIFLVHGIKQSAADMRFLAMTLQDPLYGIDTARFKVDFSFSYSDCAQNTRCNSSRCTIPEIAKRLADYINRQNPQGDIIVIGYSLGGLVARDMMLNNYSNVFANRRVAALVTLGTPNAGYPYFGGLDDQYACPTLLQQMGSNFRQPSNTVGMSEYLFRLNTMWGSSSFPGRPQVWLAAAGTFCSDAERIPPGSGTGCSDAEPRNDGVVCSQSALLRINVGNRPTEAWISNSYAHGDKWWFPSSIGINKSLFSLCLLGGNTHSLSNPPAGGDLVKKIKEVINGLTFTQGGALAEPIDLSSRQEPFPVSQASDDEVLQFLRDALDRHLPTELKDDVYLLAKSRSALAIPEMARRLTSSLQDANAPARYIYDLAEIMAYAANEEALDLLLQVTKSEPERFGPFLARLLNYATGRRNPYLLVYHALNSADPAATSYLLEWVEKDAASLQGQRTWAEALVEMGMTTEETLRSDPILLRMSAEKSWPLRQELSRLAQEVIRQRKQN
jgi:pimeloyl-ACP methyl ester carboxylesterase